MNRHCEERSNLFKIRANSGLFLGKPADAQAVGLSAALLVPTFCRDLRCARLSASIPLAAYVESFAYASRHCEALRSNLTQ
jgi:hypothetical protein